MMTKVFSKKLFGVKNEKIMRMLVISIVLFGGLYLSGLHITVAPFVINLMTTAITVGEMWHALSSDDNATNLKQVFMLPLEDKKFVFSYTACLGGYVLINRTLPLLAAIFALTGVDVRMIAVAALCVVNATLLATGIFVWKKLRVLAVLWLAGIVVGFWSLNATVWIWAVLGVSIVLGIVFLMKTDAYAFYREESDKRTVIKGRKHHSVWIYFFRYFVSHKNYVMNSFIMWIVAVILPFSFKQLAEEGSNMISFALPIGFAILSLNTPICILLSCDPELEKAVRFLPGQKSAFFVPYGFFIFACNMIAYVIYLASIQLQLGGVNAMIIIMAVLFALVSAVMSVLLECFFPIRGWKIENELWNHPRKYIVPGAMLLIASLVGMVM